MAARHDDKGVEENKEPEFRFQCSGFRFSDFLP